MKLSLIGTRALFLGCVLTGALVSCRSCSTRDDARPAPAPNDAARPTDMGEPFRVRARVPAIAWASITSKHTSIEASGMADVERSEPATPVTAFEAASIAKTVIATCVMQLVEEGKLSLNADVSTYLGFPVRHPDKTAPVTLRHLLTHTSSIVDLETSRREGLVPLEDFLRGYFVDAGNAGVFLDASPGTSSVYSNVGASLAALAVERVTATRFAERARERVFAPLRMTGTAFGRGSLRAGTLVAAPYVARGDRFDRLAVATHVLYPVVDLFATPADLARFGGAILNHGEIDGARILSAASIDEMLRVQLPDAAPDDALGWQVRTLGGRRVVGHEGEDAGASTGLYLDMASGVGALVLANGDAFQSGDTGRSAALQDLLEKLLAEARASLTAN